MEIKEMVVKARKAQEIYEHHFDQDQVDRVIREAARVIYDHAEELARLAVDETGMGVYEHKVAKNRNKSKGVYYNLRGKKSMGIIDMDEKTGLIEIAKPIGVVAGITPMTNPIVTPMSYTQDGLLIPETELELPEAGQYFIRVRATNEKGKTQDAFDYYVTDEGKQYGMRCIYVTEDGQIEEDIYEE